ncbi:MAG: hypothetical protein IJX62_09905 [Clostridia bacterium]|nr:hypothetical protein [Clostridia bacterium]
MDFYFIIGVGANIIGLWNLMIAILGLFPQCRATVAGTLSNTKTQRNVRTGKGHTRIPILTDYTYSTEKDHCRVRRVFHEKMSTTQNSHLQQH